MYGVTKFCKTAVALPYTQVGSTHTNKRDFVCIDVRCCNRPVANTILEDRGTPHGAIQIQFQHRARPVCSVHVQSPIISTSLQCAFSSPVTAVNRENYCRQFSVTVQVFRHNSNSRLDLHFPRISHMDSSDSYVYVRAFYTENSPCA